MRGSLKVIRGSIIDCKVDAIVNAANSSLLGGGGVDGVIHRAAGPGLLAECAALGGCPPGEARLTGAYNLPQRFVIHAVGPVWHGGERGEAEKLVSCYRFALTLAEEHGCASIAFPAISTGAYSYPLEPATAIAVAEVRSFLDAPGADLDVVFCCFDGKTEAAYRGALRR